jgi:hypothetical protein
MQAIHVGRCVSPIGQLFLLVIHCWNATPSPLSFQQWNVKCPRRMHCKALHLQQSRKLKNWCCSELKSAATGRNQWGCWLRGGVDQGTAVLLQGGQPPPPALHPVQLCCSQSSSGSELQYCLHIYMAKDLICCLGITRCLAGSWKNKLLTLNFIYLGWRKLIVHILHWTLLVLDDMHYSCIIYTASWWMLMVWETYFMVVGDELLSTPWTRDN